MAITKAKLIADGVITVDNLNASHGITTTHIGEGEKLFYTDARVSSYLTSNNYTTSAGGYFYDASLSANILTFSKSDGTTDSVDLSLYLDDTNLARLVSGTLDGLTGIATFTRDDSSTFTVDFSSFLADANDYVSSGSFNTSTGVLTLTRLGGGTVTVDLDGKYAEASHTHLWSHITDRPTALSAFTNDLGNYGGFLTSFTETDPIYTASSWYTTTNNASNWNTAYGWGNHANAGYQAASTAITTSNIGSQSVNYATSAGETGFLSALSDYVWNASTNGRSFARGIQASFVRSEVDGYPSYGSVVRIRTYTSEQDGGTAELYFPYNSTYGGSSMRYRLGQYSNAGWTGWKTVIDSDNIGSQSVNYASSANTSSTTTHYASRTDSSWYNAVWAAGNPSHLYSADSVQIQSSTGSIKANVFYDNNDAGYYLDPHATSNLNTVQVSTIRNNGSVADDDAFGIYWTDSADNGYAIYREPGSWSHPYPDLRIAFHTGIKLGANSSYNGIRFYTDYDMATQVMSVNNSSDGYGAGHVHVNGIMNAGDSHRAPVFYDSNDTNYKVDPSGTSRLNSVVYDNLYFATDQTYGFFGRNVYADTINGRGTDPLELNYYDGGAVKIGSGVNGSKELYAGALYDAGSRVAISRGEGRNYVDHSRYVYNNGAYSGSGWIEPSDLGVRYANSSNYANYLQTAYAGGQQLNPQVYFNNGVGVKVAMTASWGYWSDTLWINGYAGGDVLQMCALHTQRNGQPRIAISAQASNGSSYGTLYELWSSYNMDAPNKSGTSYYQTNTWMQFNGDYGLYWPSQYDAHFSPNNLSSYTQFTLRGSKNSYGGIYDNYSAVNGFMYDSAGNGGIYRQANDRWYLYHLVSNNCTSINTSVSSSAYGLYVEKGIYSTGDITAYSDVRKKTNIATIDSALDKVTKLRGVYYDRIDDLEKGRQVGVIAQEVNEVLPEAVTYAEDIDEYGVKYGNIVGVLIEAIKEQQKQIEELKAIVNGITK